MNEEKNNMELNDEEVEQASGGSCIIKPLSSEYVYCPKCNFEMTFPHGTDVDGTHTCKRCGEFFYYRGRR